MFLAFFELVDTEFTDGNIFAVILSDSNDYLFRIIMKEIKSEKWIAHNFDFYILTFAFLINQ